MSKSTKSTKRTHVLKRDSGWAVKKEGSSRALKVYKTKEEAISGANKFRETGSDVVIHRKDGSIQQWKKNTKK